MRLCDAVKILSDAGVDNPRYDARELFIRVGKVPPCELISPIYDCCSEELVLAIERRKRREPLQYIIGNVDFYRENYDVSPACLIPRQDTEILVDYAVKHIPAGKKFLDLCTGSGCIAISTLKNTTGTDCIAVDISAAALKLAKSNAQKNGVCDRIDFILKDVTESALEGEFFAILSNPPYVTESAYKALEPEIYFEPEIAFLGGESGLIFYEKILELYSEKLEDGGFFAFEIGFDQGDALRELALRHSMQAEIIKDYSGINRLAVIQKAQTP